MKARRFMGIDPGGNLGWAGDLSGRLEWGVEDMTLKRVSTEGLRWMKFRDFLDRKMDRERVSSTENVVMAYEQQNNFNRSNGASADVGKIMTAMLLEYCERAHIACVAVPNGRLKTFAVPAPPRPKKGEPKPAPPDRSKLGMIRGAELALVTVLGESAKPYGVDPTTGAMRCGPLTEHEADAFWLYWWARSNYGA